MNCEQARKLLNAYHDGELGVEQILEVENHLETCPDCAQAYEALRGLSGAIRQKATYFEAPDTLRRRLTKPAAPPWWQRYALPTVSFAALAAAIAIVSFRGPSAPGLETALLEDHVRSLQADHLFDVASSNRHTVKPWFQGKLEFSPSVPDLAPQGFPLVGGRLVYIDHRPAAALVYKRAKHVINVFVLPESKGEVPNDREGYHVLTWKMGDLDYWAISDVAAEDLKRFADEFQKS